MTEFQEGDHVRILNTAKFVPARGRNGMITGVDGKTYAVMIAGSMMEPGTRRMLQNPVYSFAANELRKREV